MISSEKSSPEKSFLWLLHEQRLSNLMMNLYLAIIQSNENTKLLQTEDPWEIDPDRFRGPYLTRDSMGRLCEWLERIKVFTKSDEIYKEQFLEPVRLIAKMLERWRTMDKRSTDLEGWVFSKSRPTITDSFSGEKKSVVSAVIPKLQSVMSVSVSESIAKQISPEYFVFGGCQPVGLVNRIHQVGSENRQTQKKVLLSEFDFLFTAYDDIQKLGSSIEMENFCEVESVQSEIKHHMGFPFVSSAKVLAVTPPQVVLQGLGGGKVLKMQMSDHYYKNAGMEDPKKLEGKYVRFFGVQWYSPRSKKAVSLEKPEMFLMQEEENADRLRFEDVAGMIRLRCKMAQSEVEKILGREIDSNDCIEVKEGIARFRYSGSYDRISADFIETMSKIRGLREKFKAVSAQLTEDHVIDEKKMKSENLAGLVRHYRELYDILLDYQMQIDLVGEYSIECAVSSLEPLPEGFIKKKIGFLKFLEIFEQEKEVRLTEKGFKILALSAERDLDARFSSVSRGVISLKNIKGEGIPPSILLEYMRKGKMLGYHPVTLDGQKTEMYWTLGGKTKESDEKIVWEYSNMRNRILDIMRTVSYPITSRGIVDSMKDGENGIGNFVVNLLLSEEERTKRVRKSGGSWEYSLEGRLYDLFQSFPQETFDMKSIFEKIHVGTVLKKEVSNILEDFKKAKVVSVINGSWTFNTNMNEKISGAANQKIREYVLKILERKSMMDENMVRGLVEGALSKGNLFKDGMERKKAVAEEIANMIDDGTIRLFDGMFSKK